MTDTEDEKLLRKLNSNVTSDVYSALIKIRKDYVRNHDKMRRLSKSPVIKIIISYLEHPKFCNVALSTIADACLEQNLMLEVIQNDGIKSLIRIMKGLVNDDVQNRACRALGNIAKSKIGYEAVHMLKPVSIIIQFLIGTSDKNCQQTAVRTLRILCKDSKSRDIIVRENGIIHIAQLLHSRNKEVQKCSIRALAELTENCSIGCARQMLEMQALKILIENYSRSEKEIREHVLMSLKNLSALDEIRCDLIKVGAVKLFAEVSTNYKSSEMSRLATLALCSCVDRLHMWANYGVSKDVGLKAILEILRRNSFKDIHGRIIIALLPLCYEQGVPDILFELGIIQILIQILKQFTERHKDEHSNPNFESFTLNDNANASGVPIEEEELSMSSITSFSSEEDLLLKEIYFEESKFSNDISNSNFSKFPCINSEPNLSPVKNIPKYDYSSYLHLHSSGASSCSPCSSRSNNALSPNVYSDSDLSSPVAGPWSPQSNTDVNGLCWSPVLSCSEDSSDDMDLQKVEVPISTSKPLKAICSLTESCPSTSSPSTLILNSITSDISTDNKKAESLNPEKEYVKLEVMHECKKSTSVKHKADNEFELSLEEMPVTKKSKLSSNSKLLQRMEIPPEKCALDHCVLVLLTQLSFHLEKRTNSEIASRECFSVLMNYIVSFQNPNPKAEKLLLSLVKNRYYFEKLIMSGFVTELENVFTLTHSTKSCVRCSQINESYTNLLSALQPEAESVYGIGTLYHILSTSEETSQFYAIHAISNLIHKKSSLFKLIIQGNGLSLLFNSFLTASKTTNPVAVLSLCQIYQSLPKTKLSEEFVKCCFSKSCNLKVTSKCVYLDATTYNVTFLVNGKKVLASREKLCQNSEYFSALLEGHFSEKEKDTVKMSNISAETLSAIFHFLHGCHAEKICLFIKDISFSELLKLLSESEKFLLYNVKAFVVDQLCHNFVPKNISKIYQVAKNFNSPTLYQKVLHFVLSMNISQKDFLLTSFEDLMSLKDYDVLNDIKLLIQNIFAECHYV